MSKADLLELKNPCGILFQILFNPSFFVLIVPPFDPDTSILVGFFLRGLCSEFLKGNNEVRQKIEYPLDIFFAPAGSVLVN